MIPATFAYDRPATIDEALSLLSEHGDAAKLLAGGQSLLPLLKLRLAHADRLIDIGGIGELRGVRDLGGGSTGIGALTTYREVADSAMVRERLPVLVEAIDTIADLQTRNRGTLGGALAHADPASDLPALMLALDAQLVLRSRNDERVVPAEHFFSGPFQTAAGHDEILTEIRIPAIPTGAGSAYVNIEQPASGYSIVGAAVVLGHAHGVFGATTYDHVRIGVTGAAETPFRASEAEAALTGTSCGPNETKAAAARATAGQTMLSDIHADAEYRAAMVEVLVRRALDRALARSS